MTEHFDIVLRQGHLLDGDGHPVDLGIRDGVITAIAPRLEATAEHDLDIQGCLISPPFVESHIHLDSALTAGEPRWNQSGTLFEGIQIWGERKRSLTLDSVKQRALEALKLQASHGVQYVRTHADVSEPSLTALKALLDVRETVQDWMTVQVIAFPQDGIYSNVQNEALLEEALKLGADGVGGIPHYELTREDGVRSVHRIFALAQQYDRLIDIHCDEIDDPQSRFLEVVAACALRQAIGHRVTASHTTAFASYDNAYAVKLMGLLRRSRINFIANPLINLTLQGRADSYPKRRGITRVKELWQQGLNVSLGHDCIQDPWYSLGNGNLLDVAHMAIHACHMTGQAEILACYDMVTRNGLQTLGLLPETAQRGSLLCQGQPANLLVLEAPTAFDVIKNRAVVMVSIYGGRLLLRRKPRALYWSLPAPETHGTSDENDKSLGNLSDP